MSGAKAATPASADETTRPASARRTGRRGEEIAKILFVVPAGLAIIVLFGYPVVKNLVMSFQDYSLRTFFTGEAPWVGLQNFVAVVEDAPNGTIPMEEFDAAMQQTAARQGLREVPEPDDEQTVDGSGGDPTSTDSEDGAITAAAEELLGESETETVAQ